MKFTLNLVKVYSLQLNKYVKNIISTYNIK